MKNNTTSLYKFASSIIYDNVDGYRTKVHIVNSVITDLLYYSFIVTKVSLFTLPIAIVVQHIIVVQYVIISHILMFV